MFGGGVGGGQGVYALKPKHYARLSDNTKMQLSATIYIHNQHFEIC